MVIYFIKFILVASLIINDNTELSIEEKAIAACESGDTQSLGSVNWDAVNINKDGTIDTGAFQFNSYWVWNQNDTWIMKNVIAQTNLSTKQFFKMYRHAKNAPPSIQRLTFMTLWNNGYGWQHWSASKQCWSKWLEINENNQAVVREEYNEQNNLENTRIH